MTPNRSHILVTGASGFVGGHLARLLAAQGFRVTAVARRPAARAALEAAGIETLATDLVAPAGLPEYFDGVVHAAATSIGPGVRIDQMVRDNVEAMRALIDRAARAGARRFIFLSSMSVYGHISVAEVNEATACVDPDAYGLTKRLCEEMLAERAPEIAGLAVRLPAVLGAGAHRNWLATTARRMLAGEDMPFFHAEAPFNNAVHVADLAAFFARLLTRGWDGFDAVNLAAAGTVRVREGLERLKAGLRSASRLVEVPPRRPSFTVSFARARGRYGYDPMMIEAMLDRYAAETVSLSAKVG
ncbi:MAG: NAD-dependent epimerase/dehydratase family protein [Pseudomonadota bacterium]